MPTHGAAPAGHETRPRALVCNSQQRVGRRFSLTYCLTASGNCRDSCLGCLSLEITPHATAPPAKRRNLRFLCPARFHNEALSGTLPRHAAAPKQMKKGRQYQSKHNLQGAGDFFPLLITTRTLLRFHRTQPAPRLIHNVSLNSSEPTPP